MTIAEAVMQVLESEAAVVLTVYQHYVPRKRDYFDVRDALSSANYLVDSGEGWPTALSVNGSTIVDDLGEAWFGDYHFRFVDGSQIQSEAHDGWHISEGGE